jgi:hypothetical protein
MIPSVGRIVQYILTEGDAAAIYSGSKLIDNSANGHKAGDVLPLLICKVWSDDPTEDTAVNGQVFVDGNFTYWATSRQQGDGEGRWHEPVRVQ